MNNEILGKIKNNKYLRCGAIALLLYSIYAIYLWSNTETTDNAYIDADISLVSAEISGVVTKVLVTENNNVLQGDIVAEIDDQDYKATLLSSIAEVEAGAETIKIAEQKIVIEEINLQKNNTALELAKTNYDFALTDYNRTLELKKDKFASQKILDTAQGKYQQTKSAYNQAILDVETSNKNLLVLSADKALKAANLQGLVQAKNMAQHNLDNTKLRAPINGKLANSGLRAGNYVRPGVILYSIVPDNLYVRANFKETQISKFKPGMKVELKFDSLPGKKIAGTIRSFAPATGSKFSLLPQDNATGNFTKIVQRIPILIDFQLENQYPQLVPGMSAIVSVKTN